MISFNSRSPDLWVPLMWNIKLEIGKDKYHTERLRAAKYERRDTG